MGIWRAGHDQMHRLVVDVGKVSGIALVDDMLGLIHRAPFRAYAAARLEPPTSLRSSARISPPCHPLRIVNTCLISISRWNASRTAFRTMAPGISAAPVIKSAAIGRATKPWGHGGFFLRNRAGSRRRNLWMPARPFFVNLASDGPEIEAANRRFPDLSLPALQIA